MPFVPLPGLSTDVNVCRCALWLNGLRRGNDVVIEIQAANPPKMRTPLDLAAATTPLTLKSTTLTTTHNATVTTLPPTPLLSSFDWLVALFSGGTTVSTRELSLSGAPIQDGSDDGAAAADSVDNGHNTAQVQQPSESESAAAAAAAAAAAGTNWVALPGQMAESVLGPKWGRKWEPFCYTGGAFCNMQVMLSSMNMIGGCV